MDVDPRVGESRQHLFAVAAIHRHGCLDNAVVGKRVQRALRNGIHGEWCGQGLDVKKVRSLRILGPRAGPQKALRTRAGIVGAHPSWRTQQAKIGFIGSLSDGDAELVVERLRHLAGHRDVPAANEDRRHRADIGA
jgi:hypothetical protein